MKKKIINGFLMVALLAATVTSFVSCKDNDEDVKTDLTAQIQKVNGDYQAADAALNSAIQAKLDNKADQAALDAFKQAVADNYVTKTEFDQFKEDVGDDIEDIWNALNDTTDPNSVVRQLAAINDAISGEDGINEKIQKADETLKDIQNQIDAIVEALSKMVTSVTVNATSNSILSNSKVFPGLNIQFVGAAYGEPISAKGAFPSMDSDLDAAAIEGVEDLPGYYKWENNELIMSKDENENNAGKIYFTVNPSNVNPKELKNLSLVNSLQKEYFTLDKESIAPCTTELTWGLTRADYPATLWEASVNYDVESVKAIELKNVIDFGALKNNVKNIINTAKDANKSNMGSTASSILKETAGAVANLLNSKINAMPAVALKAEWEDTVGTRSVLSDYSIAATAYKPMSFNELHADSKKYVSLDKIDNAFAKIINELLDEINKFNGSINIDLDNIDIDYAKFDKSYEFFFELTSKPIEGTAAGLNYKVQFINNLAIVSSDKVDEWKNDKTMSVKDGDNWTDGWRKLDDGFTADYSKDIEDLVTAIKNGIDISGFVNQFASTIKTVNDLADRAKNIENRTTDYLEKFINKSINFIATGQILEPILLVDGKNGVARATGTYEAGKYTFIPTSMNYELIAPAFKKYIAVLDKDGKVIPGSQKILTKGEKNFSSVEVELDTNAAKIVYAAMDFKGYQVAKVYNVTVK